MSEKKQGRGAERRFDGKGDRPQGRRETTPRQEGRSQESWSQNGRPQGSRGSGRPAGRTQQGRFGRDGEDRRGASRSEQAYGGRDDRRGSADRRPGVQDGPRAGQSARRDSGRVRPAEGYRPGGEERRQHPGDDNRMHPGGRPMNDRRAGGARRADRVERQPVAGRPQGQAAYGEDGTRQERDEALEATLLEGKNAVWEALKAGRKMDKLLLAQGLEQEGVAGILGIARRNRVRIETVPRARLDELSPSGKHQGVMAFVPAMDYVSLDDLMTRAFATTETPMLIVLDELQDPHNLGAIIRTVDCAGAQGVIIMAHRAVGLTATVAKVSAGALAHVPVAKVTNLAQTLDSLREQGFTVLGADMQGQSCYKADFCRPIALVVGNEGKGLRRLVAEKCDEMVSLPLLGHVDSLNASVASALLLYEGVRQRLEMFEDEQA